MTLLNRRHFIRSATVGVAATALPISAFAAERSDVLILGAGLSGLYAADFLKQQGLSVTVLEAKSEAGGRTKSISLDGETFNLGGNEVGSDYGRMISLAAKYGIDMVEAPARTQTSYDINVGGEMVALKDWASSRLNLLPNSEREIPPHLLETRLFYSKLPFRGLDDWLKPEYAHLDISQLAFLKQSGASDQAISYINQFALSPGADRTSALSVFRDAARYTFTGFDAESADTDVLGGDLASYRVKGGTQKVCLAIANALGEDIHHNQIASRITHDGSGVTVSTLSGAQYKASFLIIALPLMALSKIDISPALPEVQRRGIQNARYAGGVQVHCRVNREKLMQDGFSPAFVGDGPIELFMVFPGVDGHSDRGVIWLNGAGADRIDQLPRQDVSDYLLSQMRRIRPSSEGALEYMFHYSWSRDPYAGGIRYVYGPGEASTFGRVINKPMGRIVLAGEHARINDLGMEGALESGFNAVVATLKTAQ